MSALNGISLVCNVVPFLDSLSAVSLQATVFMKNGVEKMRCSSEWVPTCLRCFSKEEINKYNLFNQHTKLFPVLVVMPMNFELLWCG